MEESKKVLEIEVPQGYEIDKEQSSFEKIVFKKVEEKLTYRKITSKLFDNKVYYYIDAFGNIRKADTTHTICHTTNPNDAATEHQLERLLAINKLMNVAYYLNKDWEIDWARFTQSKYFLSYNSKSKTITIDCNCVYNNGVVYFKSKELAEQAIEILGEETVKLALGVI